MKCSICRNEIEVKVFGSSIWDEGNNAYPVNEGRCCDDCDSSVVIPARLKE
jgi:hypothetical protein